MKIHQMHSEAMYCLIAPNGDPQVTTLASDAAGSYAISKLLHKAGYGQSPESLLKQGYRLAPVAVTIVQNGPVDEDMNRALYAPKGIKPKL